MIPTHRAVKSFLVRKKNSGVSGLGQYRIIYRIEEEVKVVNVTKVGHRKDVYRHG